MLIARTLSWFLPLALLVLNSGSATGQSFPKKPIRILTNEVGGGSDFAARLIAQGLTASWGQPIIIQNGNAFIVTQTAVKAQADGYTLLFAGSTMWLVPYMRDNVPWDPVKDFTPITLTTEATNILAVHPSLPVKSAKDLIALAKAKPGDLNFSTGAAGSAVHLAAELFKSMAGIKIVRVAYKSGVASLNGLASNETQMSFPTATGVATFLKAGKVKALAVTSAQPSVLFPDLPTVAASGLPGYELTNPTGLFAPAKTPTAIINQLNREIVRTLNSAPVKEKFLNVGVEIVASSPAQFASKIKSEMSRMSKVIKEAGIREE